MADVDTEAIAILRLLINDPDCPEALFTDAEIQQFLTLEGGHVKLAAAQAIDTIADNEALVGKVIRDRQLSTDGAKVADSLRKRAQALRDQAQDEADRDDDASFFFGVVGNERCGHPELTGWV